MAYTIDFPVMTEAQRLQATELAQRVAAIEGEIAALSDVRATQEAIWRKKENFLKTQLGLAQVAFRDLRKASVSGSE